MTGRAALIFAAIVTVAAAALWLGGRAFRVRRGSNPSGGLGATVDASDRPLEAGGGQEPATRTFRDRVQSAAEIDASAPKLRTAEEILAILVDAGFRPGNKGTVSDRRRDGKTSLDPAEVHASLPKLRTAKEMTSILSKAGLRPDDAGVFRLPGIKMGGLQAAYDPNHQSPIVGIQNCMRRVSACAFQTRDAEGCLRTAPRCKSDTPWKGDPAGDDCCPSSCIDEYFERAARGVAQSLFDVFYETDCYPGFREYMGYE